MSEAYGTFLNAKAQIGSMDGFEPTYLPDFLYDFQRDLVEWSTRLGKSAIFADCGLGKGQPYGSLVLTPTGWRKIESLSIGDRVIASDGKAAHVLGVYHKTVQPTYRIRFSDGVSLVVDEDHLHVCRTNNDRQRGGDWRVMSTHDLLSAGNLRYGENGKSRNYDIPIVGDVEFTSGKPLEIDPYVLGVLLGDGHLSGSVSVSSADREVLESMSQRLPGGVSLKHKGGYDYRIVTGLTGTRRHPFRQALCDMDLMDTRSHTKFVPDQYLHSSIDSRINLLRGLMDTDGYIGTGGCCQYHSVSKQLSDGPWTYRKLSRWR